MRRVRPGSARSARRGAVIGRRELGSARRSTPIRKRPGRGSTPRRNELGPVAGADPRQAAGIDKLLPAPVVNRLITDLQVPNQLRDRAAGPRQVQHLTTKLRWIAPRHAYSTRDHRHAVNQTISVKPGE